MRMTMTSTKPAIRSHLREAILDHGLTQRDLAELAGVSDATVRCALRQDGNPSLDDVLRIARALDATVSELFEIDDRRSAGR
jgi:transcriptional regulator with XRE-family HTH domain